MDKPNQLFNEKNRSLDPIFTSNLRLFIIVIAGIFLAEVVAMLVIYNIKPEPYWVETLLDATIMTVLIFPVIYYFHFRVLLRHIHDRNLSEALLMRVLENLPVGVWIINQNGDILHGNPASQQIWAGTRYVGMNQYGEYKGWWLENGKRIETDEWAAARAITRGETILNQEVEIENFDGARKVILNSAVPILDEQKTVLGAIVVNQDITARKKTEQELKRSEELFRTAIETLPVGIWLADSSGKIFYGNPAGQQIWAGVQYVGVDQFAKYKGWWLDTGKPIQPDEWAITRAIRNEETSINEEIEIECFDGTHKIILNSAFPLYDEKQHISGAFVINQDITEQKHARLQLERQHQELQALSLVEHQQRELAETLNAVSLALSQTLNLETVMTTLIDYSCRLVPADYAFIMIAESETDLTLRSMHSKLRENNLQLAINSSFDGRDIPCVQEAISTQKSVLIQETRDDPRWTPFFTKEVIRSWLGVPMLAEGKIIGVLALVGTEPDAFKAEHVKLVEAIVFQAAVAIQNAWLFEQVRSGHERLQSLSRRLVEVQESERRYIARELHDEASQALTALKFGLRLMEQEIDQPEILKAHVVELKRLTDEVLEELHRLAINLRPASLDYLGLESALEQLAKGIYERYALKTRFKTVGFSQEKRLPDYVETALYRIVQEALTNAVRHSQANNIDVILEMDEGKVMVMVEDDGVGFEPAAIDQKGHLGLLGMQERAQMIAGSLQIESRPGGGTTVVVEVPYAD